MNGMTSGEICVPADALQLSGEDGAGVAPAEGDTVSMTVEGVVTRSDGGNVYVKPKSVNGAAIPESGPEATAEVEEPTRESIMAELSGGNYA